MPISTRSDILSDLPALIWVAQESQEGPSAPSQARPATKEDTVLPGPISASLMYYFICFVGFY